MSFILMGELSNSFLTSNFIAGSINFSKSLPSKLSTYGFFSIKSFFEKVTSFDASCNARAIRELTFKSSKK